MCPSSWKLYVDDFPFFWFLSSLSRTRARAVWSLGVWELMPLAMMMICRTFFSQTSNSSSSESRWAREEPKKGKSSTYDFQDDGHISSCPFVHAQLVFPVRSTFQGDLHPPIGGHQPVLYFIIQWWDTGAISLQPQWSTAELCCRELSWLPFFICIWIFTQQGNLLQGAHLIWS